MSLMKFFNIVKFHLRLMSLNYLNVGELVQRFLPLSFHGHAFGQHNIQRRK